MAPSSEEVPIFPPWTDKDKVLLKTAKANKKLSMLQVSESNPNTEEYWKAVREDLRLEGNVDDLRWARDKRYCRTIRSLKNHTEAYEEQREVLKRRDQAAARRQARYHKVNDILTLAETNNLTAVRPAYLRFLLDLIRTPFRRSESTLVYDMRRAYGYKKNKHYWCGVYCTKQVWNVLVGGWISTCNVKATHIVPPSHGEDSMVYIFGRKAKKEMNSARNGLFLPLGFEEHFRNHEIVIVPANLQNASADSPRLWKVLILSKSLMAVNHYHRGGDTYGDLHGKTLVFQNHNQPRARYFYFHYLVAMLKMARAGTNPGVKKTQLDELNRAWASEWCYMRENIIRAFLEGMGNNLPEGAAKQILSHSNKAITPDETKELARSIGDMDLNSDDEYDDGDEDEFDDICYYGYESESDEEIDDDIGKLFLT